MGREAYEAVVDDMRLPSGLAWSVPVTLGVAPDELERAGSADEVELVDEGGRFLGVIEVDRPLRDRPRARGAPRLRHARRRPTPAWPRSTPTAAPRWPAPCGWRRGCRSTPPQCRSCSTRGASRAEFDERGWKSVVGFQTRNPIHRAHEYITKVALESVDGLFIHPLVGETKSDDIPADVRMRCYEVLIEHYYPPDHVVLGVTAGRDALRRPPRGDLPRRSCARTTAAPTSSWAATTPASGTTTAPTTPRRSSTSSRRDELAIEPMMFEHSFYCKLTKGMATSKTTPAGPEDRVFLSGTKVREMLGRGEIPPEEFTRPEVAKVLIEAYSGTPV